MFILRYVKNSFNFKELIHRTDEKLWKVLIYFILLSLISAFPLNLLIVQQQGWRLDFVEQAFINETPTWDLPRDCRIELNHFFCPTDQVYTYEHQGITFVFNGDPDNYRTDIKQIIFTEDRLIYTSGEAEMEGSYAGFVEPFGFNDFNLLDQTERVQAFIEFGQKVESSFSNYIVFYSIMVTTLTTIGINFLFILMLSAVLQLFRFGYSHFFRYTESLNFLIFVMGVPAIVSFFVGLFAPAFSTVIFQFGMGIITMLIMLKFGKTRFA